MCASQRVSKPVRRKEADWLILTVHSRPTLIFREGFECEHTCRDPKDGELCLSGRPEETLVEARSDTDANRSPDLELAMRDEPKPGYGAQLRANLEPTKGVGRLRQQDGGHGSRNPLRRREPGGAAAGADLGGSSKYSNENFEGRRGERFHVNGTCTWPAHPGNGSAGGLQGEQPLFNPPTVGGLLEPLTWRARPPRVGRGRTGNGSFELSPGVEQPTQNCALNVKVKKFNQARVNGWSHYDSLQKSYHRDNWLVAAKPLIATLLFDPSMSALPIIVKQNSPSVGLFTHQ
ncbi:hypothetical protein Bca4012_102500 [Brassica carinata]